MAYADYRDMMTLAEELLDHVVKTVNCGASVVQTASRDEHGNVIPGETIDFAPPYRKMDYFRELISRTGIDLSADDLDNPGLIDELARFCAEREIPLPKPITLPRLLNKLVEHLLEAEISEPCFIVDYPQVSGFPALA